MCYGRGHPSLYETPPREFPIGSEYLDILTGKYRRRKRLFINKLDNKIYGNKNSDAA